MINKYIKKVYILLLIILILFSLNISITSCSKKEPEIKSDESSIFLKTAKIIKGNISRSITLVGRIKPKIKDELYFEADGVIKYLVSEGDKVKEGDILAEVDSSSLKEDVSSKETELNLARDEYDKVLRDNHFYEINVDNEIYSAKKELEFAKKDSELAKDIYNKSSKTKEDKLAYERAKYSYENIKISYNNKLLEIEKQRQEYKFQISQAQEKLNNAQELYNEIKDNLDEKTTIYAPYSCQIVSLDKEDNKKITAYENVITVADYEKYEIKIQIDETDITKIKLNMDADISLDAYPDKELTGKISYISSVAKVTEAGVFYEAIIDITDKADIKNIYGLTADINLILEGKKDVLIIPEVAINEVAGKKMVEIRNEDKSITQIEIKTGITDYTYTEIISGLNEGDEVVISR